MEINNINSNIQEILKSVTVHELTEEEKALEAQREEEKYQTRLKAANVPIRYRGATFENLERYGIPLEIEGNYIKVKQYAKDFKKNNEDRMRMTAGQGIIFAGSVGRMKTTMAVAVLQYVLKQGLSGYFISLPELLDTLQEMMDGDKQEFKRYLNKVTNTALLVLDDIGVEYPNNWVLNKVDAIITRRYNARLPIIITTNMNREQLKARYAERIYDRLKQTSLQIIDTTNHSLRKEFK